jgi:hypothetical protein
MTSACSKFFLLVTALNAVGGCLLSWGSSRDSGIEPPAAPAQAAEEMYVACNAEPATQAQRNAPKPCEPKQRPGYQH